MLESCREQGLLIGKGGLYGNALRLAPPLVITEEDAARAIETLDVAFGQIQEAAS